jgi:CubicO group peptidase (beta-lactamase class C family)
MQLSKSIFALSSFFVSLSAYAVTLAATPLPVASAEKAGFSVEGLQRIDAFFAREVAADRVPGAVIAIARDGKLVHYTTKRMVF